MVVVTRMFPNYSQGRKNLRPLTTVKNAPNPGSSQGKRYLSKNWQNRNGDFWRNIFDKLRSSPPDWNPEKQSSGPISDKFASWGVFECCKGRRVRNTTAGTTFHSTFCGPKWPIWDPLFDPKIPLKEFLWVPFLHYFPGNELQKVFLKVQSGGFLKGLCASDLRSLRLPFQL